MEIYKKDEEETTIDLFNKRGLYNALPENNSYPNIIDFLAEKIMYGKVNRSFSPITIPQTNNRLKTFPNKKITNQDIKALNFVVDAFTDLQQQFDKCRVLGKIDDSDQYLSSLKIHKAYVDPHRYYERYLLKFYKTIDNSGIENFDNFVSQLLFNMKKSGLTNPLTFPAFVKSRKTPMNISGLVIEIADLGLNNDQEKVNLFSKSKNWNFYVNTCKSYGFMVDKNIPWRIIADIGSETMIEYAKKYNLFDTDDILLNCYERSPSRYYNTFTQNMLDLYNNIKPRSIIKLTECNGKTITNRTKPKEYTNTEILQNSYGQDNFLMLYCKLRFTEEESQYTEEEKRSIIRETLQISKSKSRYFAIKNFESLINKTFDYQGSLGYYIRGQREREQQEIFGETTSTSFTDSSPARRGGGSSGGGQSSSGY